MTPGPFRRRLPLAILAAVLTVFALAVAPSAAQRLAFLFDDEPLEASPGGFFYATARQAAPGHWDVVGRNGIRHLRHTANSTVTMRGMSLAGPVFDVPQNIKVSTRLRLSDGDGAGGVFWRYKDANNFYFVSVFYANHSAAIVRVTEGNRILLAEVKDISPDPAAWHAVVAVHDGDEIRASIDGIGILRAKDHTLWDGNRAGVWSAGNTTGLFDDLVIEKAQ